MNRPRFPTWQLLALQTVLATIAVLGYSRTASAQDSEKPPPFSEAAKEDDSDDEEEERSREEERPTQSPEGTESDEDSSAPDEASEMPRSRERESPSESTEREESVEPDGERRLGEPIDSTEKVSDDPETSSELATDSDDEKKRGRWAVTAEVFTEFPLQIGGAAVVDTPAPIQLRGGLGYLPGPYIRTANDILVGTFGGYDRTDARLVESTVKNSLLWHVGAGYIAGDNEGFYVNGGYTAATFGGTAASAALIEKATGEDIPSRVKDRADSLEFDVSSSLHQFDLEAGFVWRFSHVTLRTGIGWSLTFASAADVVSSFQGERSRVREAVDAVESKAENYLNETYRSYVHPPYVSLGLGFSIF